MMALNLLSLFLFSFTLTTLTHGQNYVIVNYFSDPVCNTSISSVYQSNSCNNGYYTTCNTTGLYYYSCQATNCSSSCSKPFFVNNSYCFSSDETSTSEYCSLVVDPDNLMNFGNIKAKYYHDEDCLGSIKTIGFNKLNTCSYMFSNLEDYPFAYYDCTSDNNMKLISCKDSQCEGECVSEEVQSTCNGGWMYSCIPSSKSSSSSSSSSTSSSNSSSLSSSSSSSSSSTSSSSTNSPYSVFLTLSFALFGYCCRAS